MIGGARHRIRDWSAGIALVLLGVSFPLAITAGNKYVGGEKTIRALWGAVLVAGLVWFFATDTAAKRWSRGPKLVSGEVVHYWRFAVASRGTNDLQVVYAKVRNIRNGGGDAKTLKDAEAWMRAYDENNNLVADCQGNWIRLNTGIPNEAIIKSVSIKPTGEEFGHEIGGKFIWGSNAYLAGETNPSLAPGTYRIRASVSDGQGARKAQVLEWQVVNPGKNQTLLIDGKTPTGGEPPSSIPSTVPEKPASNASSEVTIFANDHEEARNVAEELIKRGSTLLSTEYKHGMPSDTPGTARPNGPQELNGWLQDARVAMAAHFAEQAYRVANDVSENSSSKAIEAAINHTMPALQNFRTHYKS
jgi:hypothetical protein